MPGKALCPPGLACPADTWLPAPFHGLIGGVLGLPYYRFFPADYMRDTRRLTLLQHGAYRILIDEYMGAGGLRGDLDGMCRICGALSGEERAAVEFILGEFFIRAGPGWGHKRCDEELGHLASKTFAARDSALKRWQCERNASAKRRQKKRNASPESESDPESVESKSKSTPARATRLPLDWRLSEELKQWAVDAHHLDPRKVVAISAAFRDYWIGLPGAKGCKLDWDATFRNWIRKEVEHG